MKRRQLRTVCLVLLVLGVPGAALAQHELNWDNIEVTAHLDAPGNLRIVETQTMRFSGDWNGGERKFNIRPRQKLAFTGIYRNTGGGWSAMTEDAKLDDIDDYAWADRQTLRWRSRRSSDPDFVNTAILYELRYTLTGILLKDGDAYLLDHDFAFPDRYGIINRFALRLTFDPAWQPMSDVRDVYTATGLPPGKGFVVRLPLRYTGVLVPSTLDLTRPREIVIAVAILLGVTALAVLWFFVREESEGRFAPVATEQIDEPWLREHILKYPAEVVGAAWDDTIGAPEVVALIGRMVAEGKLESALVDGGGSPSMTLRLKVDRTTLEGHERTLVERLFFDGRTETSTELVKEHYRDQGFNPANEIKRELEASVERLLPGGEAPRRLALAGLALFIVGLGALAFAWYLGDIDTGPAVFLGVGALVLAATGSILGMVFREHIHWGRSAALYCLAPALLAALKAADFLWFDVGSGAVDLALSAVLAIVALALGVAIISTNALKSRQHRDAIAFRKRLAAGRAFFMSELGKAQPALRDEWYPWILAFGLGSQVDAWSAQRAGQDDRVPRYADDSTRSPVDEPSSEPWTGFGGGRSGGGGGGASWAAAAGGMAAGVSAPSVTVSGSDSGSGSSSGSFGGSDSSSSGSSGGGGGGGW